MNRKVFWLVSIIALSIMLALGSGSAQAQGTPSYVPLWLVDGSLGDSVIFQSDNGNIGIGTTSPGAKFEIAANNQRPFRSVGLGSFDWAGMVDRAGTAGGGGLLLRTGSINTGSPVLQVETNHPDLGGSLTTRIFTVMDSGNVGIGTTNPAAKLEVVGNWDGGTTALRLSGEKPTIQFAGDAVSGNRTWFLHLGANGPGDLEFYSNASAIPRMALRPVSSGDVSQVVINAQNALDLVVRSQRIVDKFLV